ncbi:MAG: flagellar biosynthesis protein FlhA [Gemmatales bacterium]|nr:MAG: flagellar biosynthesis protein FlhA [Gemmatales bacterium]
MPLQAQRALSVLSLAILGILAILLMPLPSWVLDMLIALNLGLTILVLLITLSATQPLDFSVFPSLLLLMTLYRLALNVATTRLILLQGDAGHIVETFGNFVVGGNLVVGLVVFLILVVIQFVVITRGAGRISEVSARFTLDSLPGKQMAIDAELNTGAIDEAEARRRRERLVQETEFYGAMDGASKFVRGDAIAGLIITAINLVGGIIIGMMRGLPIERSVRIYSILTIGDGLVSQIPALIIATASGILVTKATSQSSLGEEIGSQVSTNPQPLAIGAMILVGIALLPGLPMIPFLFLAGILYVASRRLSPTGQAAEKVIVEETVPAARPPTEAPLEDFLQVDRISVEIGARLIPFVDSKRTAGLIDRIGGLRRDLGKQSGLWVPPIRVRDNIQMDPNSYRILISGREVARGSLQPERWLAINPGGVHAAIEGQDTTEPAFGLPAKWIAEHDRQRAEMAGYTVVDALSVFITHLGEVVRRHAHELLGREDVKTLVEKVRETSPSLVEDLIPSSLTLGTLHRVLTLLLEERVPISDLTRILESLAHYVPMTKDPVELAERVRVDLGRAICDRFRDENGRLHVLVLDPRLELELRRSVHEKNIVFDPARLEKLMVRLINEWRLASAKGQEIALLCDSTIRRSLRQTLVRSLPDLAVIAYQEVPSDMQIEPVAIIKPDELAA